MAKKTSKKPPKNGNRQKQKQKQTVIVNINNGKTRAKRQTKKPSVIKTPQYINTFPVFQQTEPSPPLIHNVTPEPVRPVISEPVRPIIVSKSITTIKRRIKPKVKKVNKKEATGNYDYIPPSTPSSGAINLLNVFDSSDDFTGVNRMNYKPKKKEKTAEELEAIRITKNAQSRARYAKNKAIFQFN
jgi:hypothetical protein